MSRLRGRGRVMGVIAVLATGCQMDNPGFKLMADASSGMATTPGMTGEGTSGGSTASVGSSAGDSGSAGGTGTGSETGSPGTGESASSSTGAGESDAGTGGTVCVAMAACYTGPPSSLGVGSCQGGAATCTELGEFKACEGEVLPQPDPCNTADDEDCNNTIVGCSGCVPGTVVACYSGPPETKGVGLCKGGKATCTVEGILGACADEVTPAMEMCENGLDEDCDGSADNCG